MGAMFDISERKELERQLHQRVEEYRRLVGLMADREVRMAELKEVIRALRGQLQEVGLESVADGLLKQEGL